MSAPQNDGGPAFPTSADHGTTDAGFPILTQGGGMTLRDYFAGQALTGVLLENGQQGQEAQKNPKQAAAWAYDYADAMLEARK